MAGCHFRSKGRKFYTSLQILLCGMPESIVNKHRRGRKIIKDCSKCKMPCHLPDCICFVPGQCMPKMTHIMQELTLLVVGEWWYFSFLWVEHVTYICSKSLRWLTRYDISVDIQPALHYQDELLPVLIKTRNTTSPNQSEQDT